jgi:hypothetical protein
MSEPGFIPTDALDPWLIDELDLEPGEVDPRRLSLGFPKHTSKPGAWVGSSSRRRSRTTL